MISLSEILADHSLSAVKRQYYMAKAETDDFHNSCIIKVKLAVFKDFSDLWDHINLNNSKFKKHFRLHGFIVMPYFFTGEDLLCNDKSLFTISLDSKITLHIDSSDQDNLDKLRERFLDCWERLFQELEGKILEMHG